MQDKIAFLVHIFYSDLIRIWLILTQIWLQFDSFWFRFDFNILQKGTECDILQVFR